MPSDNLADKDGLLRSVASAAKLREGPSGVEQLLRALLRATQEQGAAQLTLRILARMTRMPAPVVASACIALRDAGVLAPGPALLFTPGGLRAMQQWGWATSEHAAQPGVACVPCEGTGVNPQGPGWADLLGKLRLHNLGTDASPESALRLVALMHENGALAGKDLLVMGEDVHPAVAVALAGRALSSSGRLTRRTVALHPDERLLTRLRDIAVSEGAIIGLVKHDPARSLPDDLHGEFTTLVADAPISLRGLVLLLSRVVEAARPDDARLFLLYSPEYPDERLDAQRAMLDMGFVVERLISRFQAGANGTAKDLYVLSVTGDALLMPDNLDD
ncbi:MAG: bis-aminopropyl spermidine synthase family protein [Chloroflexota bacterium]|nr:bis-aminopropyl spermidine synthase family protein [Chloroflexota bacterium]